MEVDKWHVSFICVTTLGATPEGGENNLTVLRVRFSCGCTVSATEVEPVGPAIVWLWMREVMRYISIAMH